MDVFADFVFMGDMSPTALYRVVEGLSVDGSEIATSPSFVEMSIIFFNHLDNTLNRFDLPDLWEARNRKITHQRRKAQFSALIQKKKQKYQVAMDRGGGA
jgi:hypothetical protein